ncbi:tyrosine-type recombinase/integrase [Chryseobacterium sp. MYb328]|uniref:tyrosine-type recombinase/integrase n=1 Tax=Chryseobacterium sp. MYb328 TaxID=2745231 RepID=UPI00309B0CEC
MNTGYTKQQDSFILENYGNIKIADLSDALGKSSAAIYNRYDRLKNGESILNTIQHSKENILFIKNNLLSMSDQDFSLHFNCSKRHFYDFRVSKGIERLQSCKKKISWSEFDDLFIKENVDILSNKEMAESLNRSVSSVIQRKCKVLNLTKTKAIRILPEDSEFFIFMGQMLKRWKGDLSDGTISHRRTFIFHLYKFRKKISFKEVNENLILDFKIFLQNEDKMNENTISKNLQIFKVFTNAALRSRKIKENPFAWIKIKKCKSDRVFLSKEEFLRLESLYISGKWHGVDRGVMNMFLLSCTTGLRFSDILQFDKEKMIEKDVIRLKMKKTKNEVAIPISDKAKYFINNFHHAYCNKVVNRKLKEMLNEVGINDQITFHCARHTFATLSLTIGIPIEVISKILGHSDISTTQIYAKVIDDVKIKEMQKWNF